MRICQVSGGFLPVGPGATGGMERFVHYLAQALQRQGHEVTVVDTAAERHAYALYRLVEVPMRWRADSNLLAHTMRGLLFGRAVARRLTRLFHEERFDVVNFHSQFTGLPGTTVARHLRVPAVFTMHNPLWSDAAACRSPSARAKFWMERRTEAQADRLIYLSEAVKENRLRFFGLDPASIEVVPLGVDESWFTAVEVSPAIRQKYTPTGEALILNVARIVPYKNQVTLVRALPAILREAPRARAVFVGPKDSRRYRKRLLEVVTEAGLQERVVFAGAVPLEELRQLYALASVFVLPSLQENSPQSLLEAMAQGKAIVASDIPPRREMLPEGTAMLAPPRDHEALAAALTQLLKDQGLRRRIGTRARERASKVYRWDEVAGKVDELYQALTSKVGRGAR